MFGISGTELFIIALFVIIIFGPDKLPALARTVGRFVNEFKKVQGDVETMIRKEMSTVEEAAGISDTASAASDVVAPAESTAPTRTVLADDSDEEEEEEE